MKRLLLCGLAVCAIAQPLSAQVSDAAVERIEATREAIRAYVQVRQDIARLTNEWAAEKDLIERRLALYESERERLEVQIAETEAETTSAERRIAEVNAEIADLRAATAIVAEALPAIEDRLRTLSAFFPEPLARKVNPFIGQMGRGRVAERMSYVVGVLNEVDRFNNEFTPATMQKSLEDGRQIVVDVLYAGLGGAYWADASGTTGGMLTPARDGWESHQMDEHAATIRMALDWQKGENKPASFVSLPFQLIDIQ